MKFYSIFSAIALSLLLSNSALAASCYSGYKDGEDPDKYYAPDGTAFDSSRECVKYANSSSTPTEEKGSEESESPEE